MNDIYQKYREIKQKLGEEYINKVDVYINNTMKHDKTVLISSISSNPVNFIDAIKYLIAYGFCPVNLSQDEKSICKPLKSPF